MPAGQVRPLCRYFQNLPGSPLEKAGPLVHRANPGLANAPRRSYLSPRLPAISQGRPARSQYIDLREVASEGFAEKWQTISNGQPAGVQATLKSMRILGALVSVASECLVDRGISLCPPPSHPPASLSPDHPEEPASLHCWQLPGGARPTQPQIVYLALAQSHRSPGSRCCHFSALPPSLPLFVSHTEAFYVSWVSGAMEK